MTIKTKLTETSVGSPSYWFSLNRLAFVITLLSFVVGSTAEDFGREFSNTKNGSQNGDETIIVMAFSAFIAFSILSVLATIMYFLFLEDRLMKRYSEEGEVVEAAVIAADFARGGNGKQWGAAKSDRLETEYVLFVEYNRPIAEGSYMTRVRKQIKAKEADITRPCHYTYCCEGNEESVVLSSPIHVQKMLQMLHDDENGFDKNQGLGTVEMLVMPDFHKSGVLRAQVERCNSQRHKLSMGALLFSGIGLSLFCVRLAAKAISSSQLDDNITDTNLITFAMMGVFSVLVLLQMVVIHFCLQTAFVDALEEEYLKSGDLVPFDEDDSSLSTGSDFFLVRNRNERANITGMPPPNQSSMLQQQLRPSPGYFPEAVAV